MDITAFNQNALDRFLVDAASKGNVEEIQQALCHGANPKTDNYRPFFFALFNGHTNCVDVLIGVSDIEKILDPALLWAAKDGHIDCLKLLLKHRTKHTNIHGALVNSARHNKVDCLQLLLQYTDAKINNSEALFDAVYHESTQAAEILLPLSEPQANGGQILSVAAYLPTDFFVKLIERIPNPDYDTVNNALVESVNLRDKEKVVILLKKSDLMYRKCEALRTALKKDYQAIAELLYDGSDLSLALKLLRQDQNVNEVQLHRLIELEQAQRQHAVLREVVDKTIGQVKLRKM